MICAVFLCFNSFSHYHAISVEGRKKREASQKIDDLPIFATCLSGNIAMLSSEVNGLAAHGSTSSIMPTMDHGDL